MLQRNVAYPRPRMFEVHGGCEIAGLDQDGQVDRVEVGFATEAARKVRAWIDQGKEFAASGTEQAGATIRLLVWPVQDRQQRGHALALNLDLTIRNTPITNTPQNPKLEAEKWMKGVLDPYNALVAGIIY